MTLIAAFETSFGPISCIATAKSTPASTSSASIIASFPWGSWFGIGYFDPFSLDFLTVHIFQSFPCAIAISKGNEAKGEGIFAPDEDIGDFSKLIECFSEILVLNVRGKSADV
jgi:hypothetical protein